MLDTNFTDLVIMFIGKERWGIMGERTVIKEETRQKNQRPRMFRVMLLNDDYTSMEFVVEVVIKVFHKPVPEATRIMLDVHNKGKGIVGLYPFDIAATKVMQVEVMAQEKGFPLKAEMEEE